MNGIDGPDPRDPGRGDTLFDRSMGDGVRGGSVEFGRGGPGVDHHNVYGRGFHFSWDSHPDGDVSGMHGTSHDDGRKI